MKIRIIFTIFFLSNVFQFNEIIFAQEWQNNNLIDIFDQKKIDDIGISNSTLLLLCQDGLYFYDENGVEKYQLDINSLGSLEKYKLDNPFFLNTFNNVFSFENIIWLTEKELPYVTKIYNDSVFRVKLFPGNYSIENSINNTFYLDETGRLWVVSSKDYFQFDKSAPILDENTLYVLGDTIEEVQIPKNIKNNYIYNFLVVNNTKYFLYIEGQKLKLTKIQNDNIEDLILDTNNVALRYSCQIFDSSLYIVGSNGWIYIVDNNEIKRQETESDINFGFNIEIMDDNLFIPTIKGLLEYNWKIDKTSISSPENFNENCYYGFNKVLKYFNSILAVYGGPIKVSCKSHKYGFAIYKLN